MLLNHVSVGVTDLQRAVAFYDAVFAALNVQRSHLIEGVAAAYGSEFEFWLNAVSDKPQMTAVGSHFAFNASSQQTVTAFYHTAIARGARCNGKPGIRAEYGEHYFAAYVIDPDGNRLEAVCLVAE
ncbi:VOC family protein [Thaumasiovibrio subtropicus]|uniref:VOC family protein n=1 Tax=Thaumasiovibrio subtropicus TaxID=1891207 RepID=UPI000B35DC8E|nr:VOC family protein [Thaumasiovibrio subtropicus]